MGKLKIKFTSSLIGLSPKQRGTIKALGFSKSQQEIEKEDTPQIRGMINKVSHLVDTKEI